MAYIDWQELSYNMRKNVAVSEARSDALREADQHKMNSLLKAEIHRIDKLILSERERVNEQFHIHSKYDSKLIIAESKRLDDIRTVDVKAISVANDRAVVRATVLANQVATSAETLRALVSSTAETQATQLAIITKQITDRLAALEMSQYQHKGTSSGMKDFAGWLFAGTMGIILVVGAILEITHH